MSKPLVIPFFIPHYGCPHHCIFCNQHIIAKHHKDLPASRDVGNVIEKYLEYAPARRPVILAFFGGNFLGLKVSKITELLDAAMPYIEKGRVDSIRFSTRPDTISMQTLEWIQPYPVSMVELGVQSMNDTVLETSERGHTAADTVNAIKLLKKKGYQTGVQIMVGLPDDTRESLEQSTKKLAELSPDTARIYPLLVLADSPLADCYRQGGYRPLTLDEGIDLSAIAVSILQKADVHIIRVGLQATDLMTSREHILAGPWHPAFGHLVFSRLLFQKMLKQMEKNEKLKSSDRILIRVNKRAVSRVQGDKNSNLVMLEQRFVGKTFVIEPDNSYSIDQVKLEPA